MKIIRPITITDAMLTSCDVAEDDGSKGEWSVITAYTAGDTVRVTTTGVHKVYEALVNVTGGSSPEVDVLADTPKWVEVSVTNRWKAFDSKIGSQTEQATSMSFQLTPGEYFDSIAFLNLSATSITVTLTDSIKGVVYDETIDLLTTTISGVDTVKDWYTYFFSSITMITDVVKFDITPYLNAVVDITINYSGGTAKVGAIILGTQTILGNTQYGAAIGIKDYSTFDVDDFGVYSITERDYSKTMEVEVEMLNAAISEIQSLLARYRATPIVWVAHEDYSCLIVYGFYKDFKIVIPYPTYSQCSLRIEGRT
ncbi:MAG: hypothetical protein WC347_05315 [Smithellaceae bacterium]|jgi:hypothetical protein